MYDRLSRIMTNENARKKRHTGAEIKRARVPRAATEKASLLDGTGRKAHGGAPHRLRSAVKLFLAQKKTAGAARCFSKASSSGFGLRKDELHARLTYCGDHDLHRKIHLLERRH